MSLPTTKEGLPSRGPPLSPVYRPVVFRLQVSQLLVEPAQSRPHAPQVLLHLLQVRLHLAHVLPWGHVEEATGRVLAAAGCGRYPASVHSFRGGSWHVRTGCHPTKSPAPSQALFIQ